ncbi:glycosyltransferase family 2 protein [Alloyangia pacifica]|uniref:Glycosyl transferase family 2 n=1 Tax=Alloyangia pacifica TaxID=311180 RepID=A0A1I6PTW8_9RHOB|nr:glycosyltransferase family 2 protein [Alloyangia pacifica]SDG35599.1 Glycosyl transferase family 2 [Alloyangia pacifica]SFS43677.1 Glycosyl transferase family 2 [Alloyangia pacifica]
MAAPSITAVICVRNEGAFLLDWLAHHLAAGVSHVVALSNDCQDGTNALLDRLAEVAPLTHIRNDGPYDKGGIQFTGLKLADRCAAVQQADWLLALDVDEFVNVHTGDHTLPALIAALPEADAITLTWRLFGNAGVVSYADIPVPQQFTRAAPVTMFWPWRSAMFKTLYRNDGTYRKLGVHRPRSPEPEKIDAVRWFDGEGRALDAQFRTRRIFSNYGRSNYALAQLNHYPLGAMESYVLKADRGRAVHSDHLLGLDYWVERNFNTDEDRSIAALATPTHALREGFAADPRLAELHGAAVRWRKMRFAELMAQEPYRALMGRLMMTPPSRPLPPELARPLIAAATRARRAGDS